MSLLDIGARPWVKFNVADSTHRRYYAEFLKDRSWKHCPVRFHVEQGYGDITAMVENKLTAYYLTQEFRRRVPERGESWAGQEVSAR